MSLIISDKTDPYPLIGDTITIRLRGLKNADGADYNLSGAAKIYCVVKTALTDLDAAALINVNNVNNSGQFVTTYAATGNIDVTLTSANTATLTADTTYYIDIKALWTTNAVVVSLMYDTITFRQRVTRATS